MSTVVCGRCKVQTFSLAISVDHVRLIGSLEKIIATTCHSLAGPQI